MVAGGRQATPTPGYHVSAGMIRVTGESLVGAGIIGLSGIFGTCREGRRVNDENSPREHERLSQ